jgi:riboflavin kinase/FMN adenylyltransferase
MMHQGPRPTFADGRRALEAHLFEFDGDLYGEWVRITWVEWLRDVERFGSVQQLQDQMERDRVRARAALAGGRTGPNRVTHA